jgi:hypothetical protein
LIANIFLHYGFDLWMTREYPGVQFERFADDVVVHCVTEGQARQVREAIGCRLVEVGLELHPDKKTHTGFLPAVATGKLTDMSHKAASWRLHRRTTSTLDDLADDVNPVLRGWLNYFTAFYPSAVIPICQRMDRHLMRWARRKYKRLERSEQRARVWLKGVRRRMPGLFAHWELRYTTSETGRHEPDEPRGSHRICGGLGLKCPGLPGTTFAIPPGMRTHTVHI